MEASNETKPLKGEKESRKRKYEFHINDNEANKSLYKHKNNKISTTKYNIFTFLPKSLLFQFFRLANVYFLFIAIIQTIPLISPLSSSTAWGPLTIVLCVSIIREAMEDITRYKYDREQNNEPVRVFRNGQWVDSTSGDLKIGEIINVHEDKPFPADLILLDSSLKEGLAFIETGTLDGEKTHKQKIALKATADFFKKGENDESHYREDCTVKGHIICDSPNTELYKLDGSMEITLGHTNSPSQSHKVPIEAKQLLLKGSLLRNTRWAIGIVVYTGHNNKLLQNSKSPRMKYSRVEHLLSKLLISILFMQFCFCVVCAALLNVYYEANILYAPYMPKYVYGFITDSTISYFTYTLLLNTMIPISLIISLEIVKVWQGYFLSVDVEGYSHTRKAYIKAGSVSLNEELGQVNFVFSDKTGTLTCNKMEYKFGVIGDVCYEYIRGEDKEASKAMRKEMDIMPFGPGTFSGNYSKGGSKYPGNIILSEDMTSTLSLEDEAAVIGEYWKSLAVCHQCEVEEKENGEIDYSSMSPDDIELVKTAKSQGYDLKKSESTTKRSVLINGEIKEYEILNILEFNSDRKRMSIIVRDGSLIKLYIKGADSVVEWINFEEKQSRVHKNSKKEFLVQAKTYIDYFSNQGYRTLLVGMRVIGEKEYQEWSNKLNMANLDLEKKKEKVAEAYAEIEKDIYIIGATIVEDKLQDRVPETIQDLRMAGIKVWMLTGDKVDTAYNIGLSCNLISTDMQIFRIQGEKGDKLEKLTQDFAKFRQTYANSEVILENINHQNKNDKLDNIPYSNKNLPSYSILIDHVTLRLILSNEEHVNTFLKIAYNAASVLCCRVSPSQKSEVVRIMKHFDKGAVTLAIGDGGNDVSMIMEAHIGVGLHGEEGKQAIQSGDYALGEFKILRRLLMFHGRCNNVRVSKMILYFFYKNFVFTIIHFYYAFYNNFSGQTIIDDWFITMYNLIFTAFPLGCLAIQDFDVRPEDGKVIESLLPFLYKENREKPIFSVGTFLLSLLRGIIHGLINFFFIVYTLGVDNTDSRGNYADLWFISVALYTNIIFIVSIRMIIITRYHTFINWIIMGIISWLLYILFIIIVNGGSSYKSFATMYVAFSGGKFYLDFILIVGTCAMIDLFTSAVTIIFSKSITGSLMILVKERTTLNNQRDLPDNIVKLLRLAEGQPSENLNKLTEKVHTEVLNINKSPSANELDLEKIDGVKISSERHNDNSA